MPGLSLRLRQSALAQTRCSIARLRPSIPALHATRYNDARFVNSHHWIHTTATCRLAEPSEREQPPSKQQTTTEVKKSRSLRERASEMWSTLKYLFRFYLNGVKQIFRDRERVKKIKTSIAEDGRDMTYEEATLVRTHASDMRKLPLFLLILVTIEELLPLMVIYTPFLLPSTCILPSQSLKIRNRFELKREECIQALRKIVESDPTLQPPYQVQEAGATLSLLPDEAIEKLVIAYNLSKWGGTTLQRGRLERHLAHLRTDDMRLATSKLLNQPQDVEDSAGLLANACTERGLRAANISINDMVEELRAWLELTQVETAVPAMELALLPTRIVELGQSEAELAAEIKKEEQKSVSEQTTSVVQEVVEQEKRNEGEKRS
ncbi:hypothetical protein MPSI1_000595 [Malassezia psittaci]|uniref:Letm1 RBD domain-containing protein n=1 Tax=Malassezia psittaci TaxID=1821823 RepID=A0AAF0F7C1_9BASI|nr:hypothetical protein MPSI1_000595 [Malassezia psittaci]